MSLHRPYLAINITDPEPVSELQVQQDCQQFHLSWSASNPSSEPAPPVQYRVSVQQRVNNEMRLVTCPDCEGLTKTRYTFTPASDTEEQHPFQFAVTSGHCDRYRSDETVSAEMPMEPCLTTTRSDKTSSGETLAAQPMYLSALSAVMTVMTALTLSY